MSFILDALKKSETDRQRQIGPALFEVKVAPPRTRLPLWAIAIAALLVVNLAIVMWMMLRHPARTAPADAAPPSAAAAAAVPAAASAPSAAPAPAPAGQVPVAAAEPGADASAAVTTGASAAGSAQGANPDDYTPAEEPAPGSLGARVRRGTSAGVPLYQDAAATPGAQIPALRLDLHVFSARPPDRFVMINMHRLHEGDSLPEGVRVESITPEGAVLSYNGSRFLLPRE